MSIINKVQHLYIITKLWIMPVRRCNLSTFYAWCQSRWV